MVLRGYAWPGLTVKVSSAEDMSACGRHPAKAPRRTREKTSGTQGIQRSILGDPGQIVGARKSLNGRKNRARKKGKNGEKSPWGQCLTRPVPNARRRSGFWLVPELVPPLSAPLSPRMPTVWIMAQWVEAGWGDVCTQAITQLFLFTIWWLDTLKEERKLSD